MEIPGPPGPGAGRHVGREAIDESYRPLLPRHGVLAGGGGFVSSCWRVVVDLDGGRLIGERTDGTGERLSSPLGDPTERMLTDEERRRVQDLAHGILDGPGRHGQRVMSADSQGLRIVVRDDAAFMLSPTGPITVGEAAELHGLLHRLARPEREPRTPTG